MRALAFVLLGCVLGALQAPLASRAAEEPAESKAVEAGRSLLAGWTDYDARLAETCWFGIHWKNGSKNLGTVKMKVELSTEEGAAYHVVSDIQVTFEADALRIHDETVLAANGETLRKETTSEAADGRRTSRVRREGDRWVVASVPGGRASRVISIESLFGHWDVAGLLVALRKIRPLKPGQYVLPGFDCPDPESSGEKAPGKREWIVPGGSSKAVRITVPPVARVPYRGADTEAHPVLVEVQGEEGLVFAVDRENRVLGFGPRNGPIRMVAGTEAEAAAEIPLSNSELARRPVLDAAMLYFAVLSGEKESGTLEDVTDWSAMREGMAEAENQPEVRVLKDRVFIERVLNSLGTGLARWKGRLHIVREMLSVDLDTANDSASVSMAGLESNPLGLRKVGGRWKFTRFPQKG